MCSSSQPTPPNASSLIKQTTQANKDTATYQAGLNQVNQVTPGGSLTYATTPGVNGGAPTTTATTKYSPGVQAIMDAMQSAQKGVATAAGTQAAGLSGLSAIKGPTYSSFTGAPTLATSIAGAGPINGAIPNAGPIQKDLGTNDFSADRQRVEDTLFGELDTKSGRDQAALETQLANKGIALGSDAYTRAMSDFQKGRTADRTSAILNAGQEQNRLQGLAATAGNFANAAQGQQFGQGAATVAQALAAQQQQFGQNATGAAFGNDAKQTMFGNQTQLTGLNNQQRQQAFQDAIAGNNQKINQALSLTNGNQIQAPTFASTPQTGVGGTDVAGIAQNGYANANNAYNQQQQQLGGIFGSLGTLGSAALPFLFSDARLKSDIEYTGDKTEDGIPTADWRYKWEPENVSHRGVIAQDVEKVRPDAVAKIGGIRMVNTRMIPEARI